ncbi:MAG: glycosyltransferase [Pseudomonadota bacterium]
MTLIVVALGSAGDVHPLLAVARALAQQGHAVEFLTNPEFEQTVRGAGLAFVPVGTRAQYQQAAGNPALWHPIKGLGVLWRNLYAPAIRPVLEHIRMRAGGSGRCAVLAPPMAFGARLAHEADGTPLVGAYTAPAMLRSCLNPLTIAQYRVPGWTPHGMRRAVWRALDHYKLEPMAAPLIAAMRQELRLPPLEASIFGEWMYAPRAGVGLYPAWFAAPQPDWPAPVTLTDFPLSGDFAAANLPGEALTFLDEGSAPLVFMPGSAMQHAHGFFAAAAQACATLGRRGILLTQQPGQLPATLPPGVRHFGALPFGALLPHAAALVHHGGIGSCAQALRAGIPQLAMPMAHDQFDNTMRLESLGVGRRIDARHLDAARMAGALAALLADASVAAACRQAALRLPGQAGGRDAAAFVQAQWLRQQP